MSKLKNLNNKRKRLLITGISGQDGYYLAHFLVRKGYDVLGLGKEAEAGSMTGWDHKVKSKVQFLTGDITETNLIRKILKNFRPDEIYNLAAISDLKTAAENPKLTILVNCEAPGMIIKESMKILPKARIFMASSAQIFDSSNPPQNELTPFKPNNLYAVAKLKLHQKYVLPFRQKGLYVCSGLLFNHESPRRDDLIIRKVTSSLVKIKSGLLDCLELGNLDSVRDWGFAGDYVEAMWKMLQQPRPDDFIIATGKKHTVRDLVELTAEIINMKIKWQGRGLNEVGLNGTGKIIVRVNPDFYRLEIGYFVGDVSKIRNKLKWRPKTNFKKLLKIMVDNA